MTGKEISKKLIVFFGGLHNASRASGFEKSTIQKWGTGERSPSPRSRAKVMAILQSDNLEAREARILDYQQQVSESGRILWKKPS
tara:strand:+ start:80 stop:334 length:255 start_codon:yes stop_codon:yes gene_type:complete